MALAVLSAAAPAKAQDSIPGPTYTEPLGIALEGWAYPYPVHFFPLAVEGEAVRMAYMDVPPQGTPNGRTAVLLHGKNFDSSYWAGTIAALAGAGWRVVVPDQLGFNKSGKPRGGYHFDLLAANTAALLDSLGLGRVDLLGHSTGGMLAVRFARSDPGRVVHLVLEDPVGLEDYRQAVPPQRTATLEEAERRQTAGTYRAFIRRYFPVLPPAQQEPFVEWRLRVALSGEFDRFVHAAAATYQMIYREPVRAEYGLLRPPVLLVVGGADRTAVLRQYAPPDAAARLGDMPALARQACAEVPRCTLAVMPGLGHVPHLEAPDAFHARLLAFLAEP